MSEQAQYLSLPPRKPGTLEKVYRKQDKSEHELERKAARASQRLESLRLTFSTTDAIYELEFRQAVQQGLAELDRGEGIPIEQVKARITEWAGK